MTYHTPLAAFKVIEACLTRCNSLVQRMLENREMRLLWFCFKNNTSQQSVLASIDGHLKTDTFNEDRDLFTLINTALQLEASREDVQKTYTSMPDMIGEVMRVTDSPQLGEYVIIVSDPMDRLEKRRCYWRTIGVSSEAKHAKLSEVLSQPNGLQQLLEVYTEKLRQGGWQPDNDLVSELHTEITLPRCRHCKKSPDKLSRCSVCKAAQYCNSECQHEHWPKHKRVCASERDILQRARRLPNI